MSMVWLCDGGSFELVEWSRIWMVGLLMDWRIGLDWDWDWDEIIEFVDGCQLGGLI